MHRSRAFVSLFLALVLSLSSATVALGATQSELEESRRKAVEARKAAQAAEERADELQLEVEALDNKIDSLQAEVKELDPQIAEATARTQRLRAEVEALRAQIVQKESEIERTQADYELQQGLLDERMTSSYKNGATFYLDLVLDSKDFSDLIARTTLVQRVIESNQGIAATLAETKADLERRKVELARNLDTANVKRQEAEAVESNLRNLRAQRQAVVGEQQGVQSHKSNLMAENKANAERLLKIAEEEERESARIQAELQAASSSGGGSFNGVMAWPTPGFYRVTSGYGYRTHPIFGTRKLHTGIDIGRNTDPEKSISGAAIVASGDGTVIYAGYRGGYGNTVMIDHGDGVVTLYAHQQSGGISVSDGQSVVKGQRIGTVGSTGYSTGPHLHFEVRVNGTPKDPMSYLR